MNRRALLKGIACVAGGLVLPASVGEVAAEVERRWWSLGAVPGREPRIVDVWEQDFIQTMPHKYGPSTPFLVIPQTFREEAWFTYYAMAKVLDGDNDRLLTVPAQYTFGNDV